MMMIMMMMTLLLRRLWKIGVSSTDCQYTHWVITVMAIKSATTQKRGQLIVGCSCDNHNDFDDTGSGNSFFWFEEGVNDMFFSLCKEVFFKEEGKGLVLVPLMVDIMILVTSNSFFLVEGATAWCPRLVPDLPPLGSFPSYAAVP